MQTPRCRRISILCALLAGLAVADHLQAATFVVAPSGRDADPGTKAQPFATLAAARDAARKAGHGPHRITLMPGDYFLTTTLELTALDNGLTIEAHEPGSATLYGGTPVTGWRRDGDKFWCADLSGVKDGTWDFRALVVNGRLADRARLPESGAFALKNVWDARYLSGAWDPKPSQEQLTTVLYDPNDAPATLDVRNADIQVYHMWDDSLCGVAKNDVNRHAFILASPTRHPPGAFGVKKYVLFNTREGMTRPGQWYLDRTAGRLVYWPLPGEEMTKAKIIAPRLQRIIHAGDAKRPIENLTVRGLAFQATTTDLGARGFGATGFGGAVHVVWGRGCLLEKLEITNVGGEGIVFKATDRASQVLDSHVHHTGACGVEIASHGPEFLFSRNHIHHVGLQSACAVGLFTSGTNMHIYRNQIHDGPYSGMACMGARNYRIEENLICRVMQKMHDGAAIYSTHFIESAMRGNMVRDIVEIGKGFGASAFYLDEQSQDSVVERNVAIGVPMPIHLHINRRSTVRDNVFIAERDLLLSFSRSANCTFQRNTIFAPGQIKVVTPNAITTWKDNVVFRNGLGKDNVPQPFTINDAMPPVPLPQRRPITHVTRIALPPTLDGEIGLQEWPRASLNLDRFSSRSEASGVPVVGKISYDDRYLYVAVSVGLYDIKKLRKGTAWGKDDGAEIAIAGQLPNGQPAVFVIRGYPSGQLQSVTDAGVPVDAARQLGNEVRFATTTWRHGWRGEWSIPFSALGLKLSPGLKVSFNLAVFRAEDEVLRCWEGTQAEAWRLDQAGTLLFK